MIETVNGVISLKYEDLPEESTANNVYIIENADFKSRAEELGHYHTTVGDIVCQSTVSDRKQELRARIRAYNRLIGPNGIVKTCKHGCHSLRDTAEYLDVTEEFLPEAPQYYKGKYGIYATIDNYVIYFEPSLSVFELV